MNVEMASSSTRCRLHQTGKCHFEWEALYITRIYTLAWLEPANNGNQSKGLSGDPARGSFRAIGGSRLYLVKDRITDIYVIL